MWVPPVTINFLTYATSSIVGGTGGPEPGRIGGGRGKGGKREF